jgi:tRNA A37 threonylcarbamoyladenosine biosynthesis protein TsaE
MIDDSRFKKIIHIDAYRFNDPKEAKVLRLEDEYKNDSNIIVVEWPSKMSYIKPDIEISFVFLDEETRSVEIKYEK